MSDLAGAGDSGREPLPPHPHNCSTAVATLLSKNELSRRGKGRLVSKYFFDVHGLFPSVDEEGHELPSDETAWREAISLAAGIFEDAEGKMRPGQEWSIDVKDEKGQPVFLIHVSTKILNRRPSSGSAA